MKKIKTFLTFFIALIAINVTAQTIETINQNIEMSDLKSVNAGHSIKSGSDLQLVGKFAQILGACAMVLGSTSRSRISNSNSVVIVGGALSICGIIMEMVGIGKVGIGGQRLMKKPYKFIN